RARASSVVAAGNEVRSDEALYRGFRERTMKKEKHLIQVERTIEARSEETRAEESDVLTVILSRPARPEVAPDESSVSVTAERAPILGIGIGRVAGRDASGGILVEFPGIDAAAPMPAASVSVGDPLQVGERVALGFDGGDPHKPVVLGRIVD